MEIKTQKKLDYLADTKAAIKAALIEQGQEVSDADTFRSYADKVLAISGVPADVHYVTFMSEDGPTELYKRPVADGDNCADPVDRGYIDAPTKDSTPQFDYTHIGWASTPGGGWDETILNAITEDKTVYAAFAAAVRYYTISYYVDGVLDKQESLAYGATPSYTPTKDGYDFVGWTPALAAVTGDASYTATWKVKASFETASWEEIAAISLAGNAATTFAIGDERDIVLEFEDGTTDTLTLQIASFDYSHYAESNGNPYMTLVAKNLLDKTSAYTTATQKTNAGILSISDTLKSFVTETVYNALPDDLAGVLRFVTSGPYSTYEKLQVQIPTLEDLGLSDNYGTAWMLPIFTSNAASRIKKTDATGEDVAAAWWVSGYRNMSGGAGLIKYDGSYLKGSNNYSESLGVCIKIHI